jgi:ubiquinol-cytochrome c reductase cytochrome c subunit
MPERPPDPALEEATNRWMIAGLVIIALMIVAFPLYRVYEPAARDEARQLHLDSLAQQGEHLFELNCSSCHGQEGLGGIAPALNSVQFLTAANDEQIASLIAVGVPGTQMAAYSLDHGGPFTLAQIDALTVYLRSLEPNAPDNPNWRNPLG